MSRVRRGEDKQPELKPNILFIFLLSQAEVLLLWEATGLVPASDLWSRFRSQSLQLKRASSTSVVWENPSALKSQQFFSPLVGIKTLGRRGNSEFSFGVCARAVSPGSKTLHMNPCVNTHNAAHPAEEGDLASADREPDLKPEADDRPKFRPQCVTGHACSRRSCLQ